MKCLISASLKLSSVLAVSSMLFISACSEKQKEQIEDILPPKVEEESFVKIPQNRTWRSAYSNGETKNNMSFIPSDEFLWYIAEFSEYPSTSKYLLITKKGNYKQTKDTVYFTNVYTVYDGTYNNDKYNNDTISKNVNEKYYYKLSTNKDTLILGTTLLY